LDTTQERVLTSIFKSDPVRAWQCVADVLSEAQEDVGWGIQHWLSDRGNGLYGDDHAGPIQFVPTSTLFAWVDQSLDDRADWLIRAWPKAMDASLGGRLTREFVARYGPNADVSHPLWCRFHSRRWAGPASEHYRSLRIQSQEWLAGEKNQPVVRW